ncbi:uncharacterized protein LOC133729859 [Rosa rugosa]|uniref:uncharacterized protein LOC133729859 n=1 Tax=Rosa rugosa TaxID=74645 RepID=UPI002B40DA20|nr:uncharacterized protein LOC133729859 [Rosa rugosa]
MVSSSLRPSSTTTTAAVANNGGARWKFREATTPSCSVNDVVCSIQAGVFLDFMVERGGGADVERGGFCHRFGGDCGRGGRRRGAGPERIMKIMPVQKQTVLVRGLLLFLYLGHVPQP